MNPILNKYSKIIAHYFLTGVVALTLLALLSGCLQNYGRLRRDLAVRESFESYNVPPEFKYYYFGTPSYPTALIGISRDLTLKSRLWREVDPNTERFREMVFWIWPDMRTELYGPRGSHIVNPEGNRVGIWYSYRFYAAVKFSEDRKTIEVMPDTPFFGGP